MPIVTSDMEVKKSSQKNEPKTRTLGKKPVQAARKKVRCYIWR